MIIDLCIAEKKIDCPITQAFLQSIWLKSESLHHHSIICGEIAGAIAEYLEFSKQDCEKIKTAGYLHDLGKLSIKESILQKPGELTEREWEQMRLHPILGSIALENIDGFGEISRIILYHHERYDGRGYPNGLSTNEIPIESIIIKVSDIYTAMTNERSYKPVYPKEYVLKVCANDMKPFFQPSDVKGITELLSEVYVKSNGNGIYSHNNIRY